MSARRAHERGNSITVVGPYARVRVILAIVLFVIAIIAVAYRGFAG